MAYVAGQAMPFPLVPVWASTVQETLAWYTDVATARTGVQQKRQLRLYPRRAFSFPAYANQDERRLLDAMRFDMGVRDWLLPIFPDQQIIAAQVNAGDVAIVCNTTGFDFAVNGQALLWQDMRTWELVTVGAVNANSLSISATQNAWPIGTRLYPVRKAVLSQSPQETQTSDDSATFTFQFQIDEPCNWPAVLPAASYRGVAVLEWRTDESQDIQTQYDRTTSTVDVNTGPIAYFDLPGMPFRQQPIYLKLWGRAAHSQLRSLVYGLAGRAGQLWVPSWQADLQLASNAVATDQSIQVNWGGYTVFSHQQTNRQDIRIELMDGTILYRRITNSSELANGEMLQLDSELGVAFTPSSVRQINFLTMCQLASDTVQIDHVTDADGIALCTLTMQAVQNVV